MFGLPPYVFQGLLIGQILAMYLYFRRYLRISCGKFESDKRMDGKTIIVTGSNSGIGKVTAKKLAKRGARVIMACRNLETANEARDEIIKETGNENVIIKKLDLSSQKSIREFAEEILKTEKKLDVLVHNAGMAEMFKKSISVDGIEKTMATNHYGPFLLTHLLIDLLKKSAPSRIVVVASECYVLARVDVKDLNPLNGFPTRLYYVSKGANIMFTRQLAKRLEGTNVTANSLHPGLIDTGIWRNVPIPFSWGLDLIKSFFKTIEDGAETTLYLTVSDELEGVSGKYYFDCKESGLMKWIQNEENEKILWNESMKTVGLRPTDPKI